MIVWTQVPSQIEDIYRVKALCDESERPVIAEYYQCVFGTDLPESLASRV